MTFAPHNEACEGFAKARKESDAVPFASWKGKNGAKFQAAAANMAALGKNAPSFKGKHLQAIGMHYLKVPA